MVLVHVHLCHSVDINCLLCGHLWRCIVVNTRKYWWTSGSGRIELQIPEEAIGDCAHQGRCDDDVAYWAPLLGLDTIDREVIERELQEYGAWDDLAVVNLKTLHERLVWVACGDLYDTPETELDEVTE